VSAETPEFYIGEFFNLFKDAAVAQVRTETAQGMRTLQNAQAAAAAATAELQARLDAARKAHDREAEHEVRRERDARQAECQAKIDAGTARMGLLEFHVKAIETLATALGLSFK
jgi:uncharacterized membrane protein YdbT with pleckstrin-like domain